MKNLEKKYHDGKSNLKLEKKRTSVKKKCNSKKKNNLIQKSSEYKRKKGIKGLVTKVNVIYFILLLLDIVLVIYSARKNIVNYVSISEQDIFVSKIRYLLLGRNYINLLIIGFFYVYTCLINYFFLQRKNTRKFLVGLFVFLVILNLVLFFLFTKRIY